MFFIYSRQQEDIRRIDEVTRGVTAREDYERVARDNGSPIWIRPTGKPLTRHATTTRRRGGGGERRRLIGFPARSSFAPSTRHRGQQRGRIKEATTISIAMSRKHCRFWETAILLSLWYPPQPSTSNEQRAK